MLLGLISLGQGVAVNVLQRAGVHLENLRIEVEKQVGTGPDQKMMGSIPYTPRVKKVLQLAQKEARALNHTYVGTEHILLGLLAEGDGVAARALKNLHVDIDQTRREILMELDPNFSPGMEISVPAESNEPEKIPVKPTATSVDVSKRYDIYCAGMSQADTAIYRNALFKSRKGLLQKREHDTLADFLEIELEDGAVVFVAMRLIVKFCEHGGAEAGVEVNAPS
jgi:ATP-dependent Clp protease ATP-binding subunit ClpA